MLERWKPEMSFEYNRELILTDNPALLEALKTIPVAEIRGIVKQTAKDKLLLEKCKEELVNKFKGFRISQRIDGEQLKCYFAVTENGIGDSWIKILDKHKSHFDNKTYPLYENVFDYLDEILDSLDFDVLYKEELGVLNLA